MHFTIFFKNGIFFNVLGACMNLRYIAKYESTIHLTVCSVLR